jgi:hypothetical protein
MPNVNNFAKMLAVSLVLIGTTLSMTAQDIEKLKERAARGEGVAQYDLALMYDNGQGVTQDSTQAALWYRKAAENNVVQAEYRLGYDYFLGRGIPQNYAQSLKWWHKASAQGYAPAEVGLGLSYYAGKGVLASNATAYFWLDIAASGNLESGKMKNVVEMRDSVGSQLSSDVLTQTQELVEKWVESAPPRPDPYQAQEDALREKQAQPSSTPYADQFLAEMQVRDAADPNSAYSRRLAQQRKMQETMNQILPKLARALLDDPSQSSAI